MNVHANTARRPRHVQEKREPRSPAIEAGSARDLMRDWAHFLSERYQDDVKLAGELTRCKSPFDWWLTVGQWSVRAARDYNSQFASFTRSAIESSRYTAAESISFFEAMQYREEEPKKEDVS